MGMSGLFLQILVESCGITVHAFTMQCTLTVTLAVLVFASLISAQNAIPTFKAEAVSAFVWDEDNLPRVASSSIQDPITGTAIHKLSHAGIEVSSRAGFERVGMGEAGELLIFTTTIVNNTDSGLSIRQSAVGVDGHLALPLSVVLTKKGLGKKDGNEAWELARLHCFSSGFFPNQNFFPSSSSSKAFKPFSVTRNSALTVSFVTKDPRNYSLLCSMEGCHPKGTMRFSITVNTTDFVFIWAGRALADCGR
jgi:hypothetical protein